MVGFPEYAITGNIGADHCNGGAIPGTDTATAISADSADEIKAFLLKYFPGGVTIAVTT